MGEIYQHPATGLGSVVIYHLELEGALVVTFVLLGQCPQFYEFHRDIVFVLCILAILANLANLAIASPLRT